MRVSDNNPNGEKKSDIVKFTKKRKDAIVLPGTNTILYQPNRVTKGNFKRFSLLQMKFFVSLIKSLQGAINEEMRGNNALQMKLFDEPNSDMVKIGIHLSEIARHDQYTDLLDAIRGLMDVNIEMESGDKKRIIFTKLITKVDLPKKVGGKSVVFIDMYKETAKQLISFEHNMLGKPVQFTKYFFETAMKAKSKYGAKMYMILSSWKVKGGFRITMDELRAQLGLEENEYANYSDFKRYVLKPIQKDLEKKADCWFNCARKDFEVKEGRKVVALNFKIIVPELEEDNQEKISRINYLLKTHAGFKDTDLKLIPSLYDKTINKEEFLARVVELISYCNDGENNVGNTVAYICKSLENEFS
ncbi:replication initiation protein [Rhizosphaericola mali]|uniref:Replication initiation protein n=1 Tax=Rhizosphaericola mali TaxID=2545455 RepID=A0A5P2G5H3_9BACT|nr:replication initiation protein [Rhizosphaericola mali]QES91056.1 replication initiation protein [Rhizosphaericola mali]